MGGDRPLFRVKRRARRFRPSHREASREEVEELERLRMELEKGDGAEDGENGGGQQGTL